jgi:hypothetical protein
MQMHAPRACVCNDLHRLLVDQKHPLTIACLVVLEHRRTKTLTHFLPIDTPAKKKKKKFPPLHVKFTIASNPYLLMELLPTTLVRISPLRMNHVRVTIL